MTPEKDGIYYDVPFDEYRRWDALSKSTLSPITVSPAHAKYRLEQPPEEKKKTGAMIFGSLVDSMLFDSQEQVEKDWFVVDDDIRRDRRTKAYQQVLEEAAGREVVKRREYLDALEAIEAIRQTTGGLLDRAVFQTSLIWTDDSSGLRLKGRPDIIDVENRMIWDLKMTQDPRPLKFGKTAAGFRYHWQAAMYLDGLRHTDLWGVGGWLWGWIAVASEPPHSVYLYVADDRVLAAGRRQVRKAVDLWARCERENDWPASTQGGPQVLPFPEWALDDEIQY